MDYEQKYKSLVEKAKDYYHCGLTCSQPVKEVLADDTYRLKAFTASDQGMIDEITNVLNYLSEQKAISYHKEIHWLKSLKERL